jgi:hypothetical protein
MKKSANSYRCSECGHKRGHKSTMVSEKEWLCSCDCHVFADGRDLPTETKDIREKWRGQAEYQRYKLLGCVFNEMDG